MCKGRQRNFIWTLLLYGWFGKSMLPCWSNHVLSSLTSEFCRRNSENPCASQPCSWLPPSLKEVEFAKLLNIDFSDPRRKLSKNKINAPKQALRKTLPHEDERQQLYTKLHQTGMDSAILRITPEFCERFIPSVAEIRTALFNFYHENYEQLLYQELIDACVKEYMEINQY